MKKSLVLMLVAMMVMFLFLPVANAEEPVVLTFSNWGDGTEQAMFQHIFDLYTAQNPNVTVNYQYIPYNEYMTKLNTMAASGTMPDLGQMPTESTLLWAENGMYADISDLFTEDQVSERINCAYYGDNKAANNSVNYISETLVLFFDKKYCEANGVTVPTRVEDAWTWDQFLEACVKLTVDVNGKHPGEEGFDPENISVYGVADIDPAVMAWSNGGGFFSPDGKEIWFDKDETVEAVQTVADLMNVYHVAPTPTSRDAIGGGNYPLMTGKVAMHVGGQYCLLWYSDFIKSGELDLGFGVLPKFKESTNIAWGNAVVVFAGSKHQEQAKDLLKFFYDTKNILDGLNTGLWMPSEASYYADDASLKSWIEGSGVRNDDYYGVIEMMKTANTSFAQMVSNSVELQNLYAPLLDQVWLGEKTASDVIRNEIMPLITPVFNDYWSSHT